MTRTIDWHWYEEDSKYHLLFGSFSAELKRSPKLGKSLWHLRLSCCPQTIYIYPTGSEEEEDLLEEACDRAIEAIEREAKKFPVWVDMLKHVKG